MEKISPELYISGPLGIFLNVETFFEYVTANSKYIWDVLIIGAGPAGLSAGWILNFTGLRYLVFGDIKESAAKFATPPFDFPLDFQQPRGDQIVESLADFVTSTNNRIQNKIIVSIFREFKDIYTLVDTEGVLYYTRRVFFAPFIPRSYVEIDGMDEFMNGQGVRYHNFKWIYQSKNKIVGLIGTGYELTRLAPYYVSLTNRLVLFSIDEVLNGDIDALDFVRRHPKITVFEKADPVEVVGTEYSLKGLRIRVNHQQEYIVKLDFLYIIPTYNRPFPDLTELGVEYDGVFVKVNQYYETTAKNIYAGGDVIGGKMSIIKALSDGYAMGYMAVEDVYKKGPEWWRTFFRDREMESPRTNRFSVFNARKTDLVKEVEKWEDLYNIYEFYTPIQEKFERLAKEFPDVKIEILFNPVLPSAIKIVPGVAKITAFLNWEVEVKIIHAFNFDSTLGERGNVTWVKVFLKGKHMGTIRGELKYGRVEDDLYYILKGYYDDAEIWEEVNPNHYDQEYMERYS